MSKRIKYPQSPQVNLAKDLSNQTRIWNDLLP